MPSVKQRTILYGMLIGLVAAMAGLMLGASPQGQSLEQLTWHWRQRTMAAAGDERIVVILLDQASLDWASNEQHLSWPWPREMYAYMLDYLKHAEAKSVALDILFTEPSAYGVEDDAALGQRINALNKDVSELPHIATAMLPQSQSGSVTTWPEGVSKRLRMFQVLYSKPGDPNHTLFEKLKVDGALFSQSSIVGSAASQGHVRSAPDRDSVIRVLPLQVFDDQIVPLLGYAMLPESPSPENDAGASIRIEPGAFTLAGQTVPLDDQGRVLLRYRNDRPDQPWPYDTLSMKDVIQSAVNISQGQPPTIPPERLKDKYVLVGFGAPGLYDLHPTPMNRATPGVLIHATALDNLLNEDAPAVTPAWWRWAFVITLAMIAGVWTMLVSTGAMATIAFIVMLALPAIVAAVAYPMGWWQEAVPSISAVALALISGLMVNYITLGRQRRFIRHAFEHYLSPKVIEQLIDNPAQLKLGGQRRELTILFADVAGFSAISETLDPEALTSLLNDYLSDMTAIVLESGGTLDKYEGDAFIAFWNAPLAQEDHALRAVNAALACQAKLASRREAFEKIAGRPLQMRIGINTGPVVVGNMGSLQRFDYTVLGDAANLASRLEGANKFFGSQTMIAQRTYESAIAHDASLRARCLGLLRVVGKSQAVCVYEPLPGDAASDDAVVLDLDSYTRAMAHIKQQQWREALAIFETAPRDAVCKLYCNKLKTLLEQDAPSWDGIWQLTEK